MAIAITSQSFVGEQILMMLTNFLREYNINRVFLSCIGFWPFQNKFARNFLRIFYFLLEISYCPFEILLLYDHWDDVQMIFEGLYQVVVLISFIIRQVNEFWNEDKFRRLYEAMDEHWDIFTNDIEVRVLKDYSMLSRKFTIYFSTLMYVMTSGFIIIPLTPAFLDIVMPLNESRPRFLAIEVEFRVDKDEYFVPIFCYTTTFIVVGMSIAVASDAMHITCTIHACSLFAAVSKQVENIISKDNNNDEISKRESCINTDFDSSREEIIYREYIICIKKHQLAIEFVDILESTYKGLSLIMLILVIGTLSLIGIRIIYALDQLEELIRFTFILTGSLMTLMIVCYSGQKIMDESQNIFHRAYAAEWYNFSPRLKSLLIITLYRSNKPCELKAGNMIQLSIATYAAVVRMAMSYFTAFLSMKD